MIRVTRRTARRMLGSVPQDKRFWCQDGRVLKNLLELETAFRLMSDDAFSYHAHEARNDFSNWVRDVIGDEKLSRDLLKSTTRARAEKNVSSRIAWLKSKLTPR